MEFDRYINELMAAPETLIPLGVITLLCFVLLKWVSGGFSRAAWYEESRILSKIKAGSASEAERAFIRKRVKLRWTYRLLPFSIVLLHPFFQSEIDGFYRTLWPFIKDNWFMLILIGIALIALKTISAIMNLNQLANDVSKHRKQ